MSASSAAQNGGTTGGKKLNNCVFSDGKINKLGETFCASFSSTAITVRIMSPARAIACGAFSLSRAVAQPAEPRSEGIRAATIARGAPDQATGIAKPAGNPSRATAVAAIDKSVTAANRAGHRCFALALAIRAGTRQLAIPAAAAAGRRRDGGPARGHPPGGSRGPWRSRCLGRSRRSGGRNDGFRTQTLLLQQLHDGSFEHGTRDGAVFHVIVLAPALHRQLAVIFLSWRHGVS